MRKLKVGRTVYLSLALALVGGGLVAEVDFNRDIRPVLSDNCFKCHGPDEEQRKAELRLDTRDGLFGDLGGGYFPIAPGRPEASEVIWRIGAEDEDDRMPPVDSGITLSEGEKRLIRQWVEEGAEWKKHWSFEPALRPELPQVSDAGWPRNGIDHFVLARLDAEGLKPAPEADRATLIRRLSLDLIGLPPTPAEVDAFLRDRSTNAYEKLVDRLLKSPRYGETMALPWLDAARYADTDGYQNDGPRYMWRWRDWVIDAYNQNKPFDEFTIEQLAGDLLPNPTLDQIVATGFNRNHRYNSESGLVFEEFLLENAVDRVDTTSTVWMGLTMGCARCHDHKFDPISIKEYYQLVAFFNNVPESGRARKFGNSEPWVVAPTEDQLAELAAQAAALKAAEGKLDAREYRIAYDQRKWEATGAAKASESKLLRRGLTAAYGFDGKDEGISVAQGQPWFSSGRFGTAATFDGESRFILDGEYRFATEDRFSLSFWIKPDTVEEGAILSNQEDKIQKKGMLVKLEDGKVQFFVISRWVAGVAAVETLDELQPGEWRHVTVVNEGQMSAIGMKIYLDGKLAQTRHLYNSNSNHNSVPKDSLLQMGGSFHEPNFKGQVDELRIYHRSLWEEEVAVLAEALSVVQIARQGPSRRSASACEKLRSYYLENEAAEPIRILAENVFQLRMDGQAYHDTLPTTMVMKEMVPRKETFLRTRGVYHQLGERVERKLPEVFPQPKEGLSQDRLGFAKWLVSGEHPLTGRVAVNRYWLKYFGKGLVRTAEDFGLQGDWPSHPKLLDWLADEFVRLDWDIKAMQKLIVTSATYRQSSRILPEVLERDPDNILYARGLRQRLPAHTLRDQALAVSGLLEGTIGGASVKPYQPDKLWENLSNMEYVQSQGGDLYRRSLYTHWKRTLPPPTMALFDAADREVCKVSTQRTNTPLQALATLNEKLYMEAARNLGQRILRQGGDTMADQIEFAFRAVAARYPTERELALLTQAYEHYRDCLSWG